MVRQTQGLGKSREGGVRGDSICGERQGQRGNLGKIHQDCVSKVVDAEVAEVIVRLHEYGSFTTDIDRLYLAAPVPEFRACLPKLRLITC